MPTPSCFFKLWLLSVALAAACHARPVPLWSYDKLLTESDFVAVVEPVENRTAHDTFPVLSPIHPSNHYEATDTRFKVHAVLKGDAAEELVVLHFNYSTNVTIILNGASFIYFFTGPLQYEKRDIKDGEPVGGITVFSQEPVWIAFLKRRSDGRFEPVTGQYDSGLSFRELHRSSFFGIPKSANMNLQSTSNLLGVGHDH